MVLKRKRAPTVKVTKEVCPIEGLSDSIEISVTCAVRSSVEFQSVESAMTLKTVIPKEYVDKTSESVSSYLQTKVLKAHSALSDVRAQGFEI